MKTQIQETDLQKFVRLYDSDRIKEFGTFIECRPQKLETGLSQAKNIIQQFNLNLTATCKGDMARRKAFEVTVKE
jgi:hypothetical protein